MTNILKVETLTVTVKNFDNFDFFDLTQLCKYLQLADVKMKLKNISNQELMQRLKKLLRTERKITHLVLLHIEEIEER